MLSVLLALVGLTAMTPAASADTAPPSPTTPATVSADALPTVQVNGVVWSQATVGNTVYAAGSFSAARPAGSAAGANLTTRNNLLAYDITTGNLITSFAHSLNGQAIVATASPDGTRLYVGGDFTTVDGASHVRIAAFNTATGALVSTFSPSVNARVKAIAATNTTVYFGGSFTSVNGIARNRLAAVSAASGSLLSWAPSADNNSVTAMVLAPSGREVIVGGAFTTLNGVSAPGLGAVDPVTGVTLPWAANQSVQDSGSGAGITSLSTDGSQVYGTGYVFGGDGNLEGSFAADPDTGAIKWIEDCHGDSYDTFAVGSVLYLVSHEHFCGNIGSFPQTNPWTYYHATAFTTYPTGTIAHNSEGDYFDWFGNPAPTQLDWYPTMTNGTYTGQNQAAWSVTGNTSYVALGGEFPTVNGTAQQGLVRFAVAAKAPNKVGPRPSTGLTPSVVSLGSGTARVAWQTTFDQDNEALTYKVVRDGNVASPVYTTTVNSTFYHLPVAGFTDTGLSPGSTHTYRVYVTDPFANSQTGSTVSVTIGSGATSAYAKDVINAGASDYWRLGEASGSTGYDWAGDNDLIEQSGVTHGIPGAIIGDANTASSFNGSINGTAGSTAPTPGSNTFTAEAWFQTTSSSGGKIVGFGDAASGNSSNYDRQIYLDNAGHLVFGVYNNATFTVSTPGTYNDGNWHQVVGAMSAAGMALYVDGKRVATDPGTTTGQAYDGYWRVGGDSLEGWPSQPTSDFLAGNIDEVSIYPTALGLAQVQQQYVDSGRALAIPPAPTDPYGKAVVANNPDLYWRLDDAAGPTAADASGNGTTGTYSGGVTYRTPSTVTTQATGVTLNGLEGLIVSNTQVNDPTTYSEELWFNTTTTSGGKLIGFGDASSGESSNYDRHVYMLDTGQLVFGVWTGQPNTITTPDAYNDGNWHQVIATQGPDGMSLYVDGHLVGTNPQNQAQAYAGYWRVGGDHTWGGASSDFFAGQVDEVAVYSSELSAARVLAHYQAAATSSLPPANQPPVAAFSPSCTNLVCSFNGSASSDPDGSVVSYAWTFDDGGSASGPTVSHTFATPGAHSATLTVTDNGGLTNAVTHGVTLSVANQPPVAAFTSNCTNLVCSFNGSGSSDPDGTVASYAWSFGDGSTGVGATPTHTYAAGGTFQVSLIVTDNLGTASTPTVNPANPSTAAVTTLASDSFNRTVSGGLGTADQGGAWTAVGSAANLSVAPGAASFRIATAGTDATAFLGGVSNTNTETDVTFTTDKAGTGGGIYAYVAGRRISANNEYHARLNIVAGKVTISLARLTGSATEVAIGSAVVLTGVTYTPGLQLRVRFQVTGLNPTTLRLKVWNASQAEPAAWQITATDSTAALQAAGAAGLRGYLSGSATNAPVVLKASNFQEIPSV